MYFLCSVKLIRKKVELKQRKDLLITLVHVCMGPFVWPWLMCRCLLGTYCNAGQRRSPPHSTHAATTPFNAECWGVFQGSGQWTGTLCGGDYTPLWNTNVQPLLPNSFLYILSTYISQPPPLLLLLSPKTNSVPFSSASLHCQLLYT